jgi:prevent-host-death family protein
MTAKERNMASRSYTTTELSRKSGDIIADALRHPVILTQRSKPRLVILNIDDYDRLMKSADARAVGTIDTMSDALFADVERAVAQYADDDEVGR